MKYSFMSFSEPQLTLSELLLKAENLGYDGIEPRVSSSHAHNIELGISTDEIKEINMMVSNSPVELACLATGICVAQSNTDKQIEDLKVYIELCNSLSIKRMRIFGGDFSDVTRDEAVHRVATAINKTFDSIGKTDVVVCFETHDHWCVPEDVLSVVKAVNHNNFAANWDIMHPVMTSKTPCDMAHAFNVLKDCIAHVHIHDGRREDSKIKFERIGNGLIDHKTAITSLKSIGYTGFISGEWINFDDKLHLESEIKTLRRLESE